MKFVFLRDRVVASLSGHSIRFEKNVPTYVPPDARKDVIAAGGVPEDDVDVAEIVEPEKKPAVVEPVDPQEREAALFAAYERMTLENKRGHFTAGGLPHMRALANILGWEVDASERDESWAKFQKGDAK
jgi:hypothetical protein